ncbi:MAG TPA: hypothetical protein PLP22_02660 [Candidatus Competibacter sp.]|nr:hypothetical protein [Candidatus Competibacteraceae bacterium]HRE53679.1 hypothetical protein [Candidatus Competibacter sp.]HUM94318.1 hypothetical protein [Candidatus Competibacter sp.]
MTDIENLTLKHLQAIRALLGEQGERLDRIEMRMGSLEQYQALFHADLVTTNVRLDQIAQRVERIERRLELNDISP